MTTIITNQNIKDLVKKYITNKEQLPTDLRYISIGDWDVSRVSDMTGLFSGHFNFNEPLNNWNVSNVTNMSRMFFFTKKFNQPLNNWNVSNVKNMNFMFSDCVNFNQSLNNWNVSNVTNMNGMFFNCCNFNQPLNNWNVSNVTDMNRMFYTALSFNQPLNSWNVSNVRDMIKMFDTAMSFDQSLNNWILHPRANITGMFNESGMTQLPEWFLIRQSQNPEDQMEIAEEENITHNININEKGFNNFTQEELVIKDFLQQNNDNIVIEINNKFYLLNKSDLRIQLSDQINNKYGCKRAGNTSMYTIDNNINFNPIYFSLSSILGLQGVVIKTSIQDLLNDSHKTYVCNNSGIVLPAIMSVAYYNGASGVSADHCQEGKETNVYNIEKSNPVEEPVEQREQETVTSVRQEETIKVQCKGVTYTFPVNIDTTLDNVKDMLLNKLIEETKIANNNYNVKFIYTGKIYKDNELNKLLTELVNPPYGITLQAMVNSITGGKTKRRKLTKRKLTKGKKLTKRRKQTKKIRQSKK